MYFKLISESLFNRRLRETVEEDNKVNQQMFNKLKNVSDYGQFVDYLKAAVEQDKKANTFLQFLQKYYNSEDDIITTLVDANASQIDVPIKDLHPTQNEVDATKSLLYPLTNAKNAEAILSGNGVTLGAPIITFKKTNVIDGHHRWSQTYALNPEATMAALDFNPGGDFNWEDCLKVVQLAIATKTGTVPTASVTGGNNLFRWGEDDVKKYVIDNISDDVVAVFEKHGKGKTKEEIADYVAGNVKTMQSHAQPEKGASKRDFMPQTNDSTVAFAAKNGLIDVTG